MEILKVFLIFSTFTFCSGANILVLLPTPFKSFVFAFKPLFDQLASRGHNVTMISPFRFQENKINHIYINDTSDILSKIVEDLSEKTHWSFFTYFWRMGIELMDAVMKDDVLINLRDDKDSKFDLLITQSMFVNEPMAAFSVKFSCPVVNIHPIQLDSWPSYLTGNTLPYSYVPTYKIPMSNKMSFWERLQNTMMYTHELLGSLYYYLPIQEARMKEFFKTDYPPLIEILKNSSLTLVDGHYSVGYVRPHLPNVVQCGGLSLKSGAPLSKEMKAMMDDSKGVVYFSLGGHLNPLKLGREKIDSFMKAFGKLEQIVLMKSNYDIPNKPKNVIISKWLPQTSILEHPKTELFITHGGLHSLTEAIYFGKPLVVMPFFADQRFNLKIIEDIGMGLKLDEFDSNKIYDVINQVISNPKYKKKAVERSKIVKDRPMETLENCVYWVEYVLRHRGAEFLRPASLDLSFYQYFLLDIIAFLIACLISPIFVIFCIFKICRSVFLRKIKTD